MTKKPRNIKNLVYLLSESVNSYFNFYVLISMSALFGLISSSVNSTLPIEIIFQNLTIPYFYGLITVSIIFVIIPIIILMFIYKKDYYIQSRRIKIIFNIKKYYHIVLLLFYIFFAIVFLSAIIPSYLTETMINRLSLFIVPSIITLFIIVASGFLIYIINPNITRHLKHNERLEIISHFQEYPKLAESSSLFLLSDINARLSDILKLNLPYLDYSGLDDVFVDIQLAMRIGKEEEKSAVSQFFNNINILPRRAKEQGISLENELIKEIDQLRVQLSTIELFRKRNDVKGAWRRSIFEIIKPYEPSILILLTFVSLIILILTYMILPKS